MKKLFLFTLLSILSISSYAQYGGEKKGKVKFYYNVGGRTSLRPTSNEQSNFFFGFYGTSTNLWSAYYLNIPTYILNKLLQVDGEEGSFGSWRYDILKMKNDGQKVDLDHGSFFGFKAKDMFSNFQYGLKFGWQPELSPFGIYVSLAYQHRQMKAKIDAISDDWSKFKMNYIRPGLGIRVTPFLSMLRQKGWSPTLEIGTSYNYTFSCKSPYDNPKDQFENGLTTSLALGARFSTWSLTAGVELDNYDMFKKDFTPDGGITMPYKDIETSHTTIFINIARDF